MTDRALPLKFRDGLFPCLLNALKRRWFESRQLDTGGGGRSTIISARDSSFPIPGKLDMDGMAKDPALPPTELTPLCKVS
jgi:hypothetical protein